MKRFFIILLSCLAVALAAVAQTPAAMLDKCAAAINSRGGTTASYSITSKDGSSTGTISMQGKKFRIISREAKSWYDGKTLWAWSPMTGEVNITTPTQSELQMTNPIAAVQYFKTGFNMKKAKAKTPNTYAIQLKPKKKGADNIQMLWLYIDTKTSMLRTARFEMTDKSVYIVKITGYKNQQLPSSTFTFNKSQVPAGTQVVDLR